MGLLIRHVIAGACAARLARRLNVVLAGKRHQGGKQQWQRCQRLASDDFHSVSRGKIKKKNIAHFYGALLQVLDREHWGCVLAGSGIEIYRAQWANLDGAAQIRWRQTRKLKKQRSLFMGLLPSGVVVGARAGRLAHRLRLAHDLHTGNAMQQPRRW